MLTNATRQKPRSAFAFSTASLAPPVDPSTSNPSSPMALLPGPSRTSSAGRPTCSDSPAPPGKSGPGVPRWKAERCRAMYSAFCSVTGHTGMYSLPLENFFAWKNGLSSTYAIDSFTSGLTSNVPSPGRSIVAVVHSVDTAACVPGIILLIPPLEDLIVYASAPIAFFLPALNAAAVNVGAQSERCIAGLTDAETVGVAEGVVEGDDAVGVGLVP
ncbi:hypothetical protein HG530_011900 [Fusarium avenaceum]|nr:hypothetical protein HG530_011900 [Fusarium avenaceum]